MFLESKPKSAGPRPSSVVDDIAKTAGSPPTGGTSCAIIAPAIIVSLAKTQATLITASATGRNSNPDGISAAVALIFNGGIGSISRITVLRGPIDGVRITMRPTLVGRAASYCLLNKGMACRPRSYPTAPSLIVEAGGLTYTPIRLENDVGIRHGEGTEFVTNNAPEHNKVSKQARSAIISVNARGSDRSRYSEVYFDSRNFAKSAFMVDLGTIVHFASLNGTGLQAEDADDVIGSSANAASYFGSAITVDTKADSAKGLVTSGKGETRGNKTRTTVWPRDPLRQRQEGKAVAEHRATRYLCCCRALVVSAHRRGYLCVHPLDNAHYKTCLRKRGVFGNGKCSSPPTGGMSITGFVSAQRQDLPIPQTCHMYMR